MKSSKQVCNESYPIGRHNAAGDDNKMGNNETLDMADGKIKKHFDLNKSSVY